MASGRAVEDIWRRNYEIFRRFVEQNGRMPSHKHGDPKKLLKWCSLQRTYRKEGRVIQQWQVDELDSLGFVWDIQEAVWCERYAKLSVFLDENGRMPNKGSDDREEYLLSVWCTQQSFDRNRGMLRQDRIDRLLAVGMVWDKRVGLRKKQDENWETIFTDAKAYVQKHGHWPFQSKNHSDKVNALALWCASQRAIRQNGELSAERESALNSAGFLWSRHEEQWLSKYGEIRAFVEQHGRWPQQLSGDGLEKSLYLWGLRQCNRKHLLDSKRVVMLEDIGFPWNRYDAQWHERFDDLKQFIDLNGRWPVTKKGGDKGENSLAAWVSHQRRRMKKGLITDDQVKHLNSIGFPWLGAKES